MRHLGLGTLAASFPEEQHAARRGGRSPHPRPGLFLAQHWLPTWAPFPGEPLETETCLSQVAGGECEIQERESEQKRKAVCCCSKGPQPSGPMIL